MVICLASSLYMVKQSVKWETLGRQLCCHVVWCIHIVHGGSNVPSLNGIT